MRTVKFDVFAKGGPPARRPLPREKKGVRRRPTPEWKLLDSIRFIKARFAYLERTGALVRTGPRSWRMRLR